MQYMCVCVCFQLKLHLMNDFKVHLFFEPDIRHTVDSSELEPVCAANTVIMELLGTRC